MEIPIRSSKPLTRQEFSLSLRPSTPSTMSSFSNGSPINSRREIAHDPTASTHDCGSPTQWQGRTDSGSLCPGSPSAGSVLPHITRPHLCTGAAALLPAPQKRRWPCPSFHAYLLQWHSLLLSTRPPARDSGSMQPSPCRSLTSMGSVSRSISTAARVPKTGTSPCPPLHWPCYVPTGKPIGTRPGSFPPRGGSTNKVLPRPLPCVGPVSRAPSVPPNDVPA